MRRPILLIAAGQIVLVVVTLQAATYPIQYHLDKTGQASLNVYDETGTLIRELHRAVPQQAGDHVLIWDGLDREGKGAKPGTYNWKLLQTGGLAAEFLLCVGTNYPIGTDLSSSGGPGTHNGAYTVAVDETGLYISANQTENIETCLLKLSPDGHNRLWSQKLPIGAKGAVAWEGARAIAVDRGEVFLLGHVAPQRVYVSKANTGEGAGRDIPVEWDPIAPDYNNNGRRIQDANNHGATDMDIHDGVLVVAYKAQNAIRWYNPQSGELLDTAEVPAPEGVSIGSGGAVFVTTGERIVRLTQANHTLGTIATGLSRPKRLDVDHATGDFFVFQAGDSQQVLRLSASGKELRAYGREGGRRQGLYHPQDFDTVTDVCADGQGGFCVAEPFCAPRRTAHFDAEGKLIAEWYGGQPWDTQGSFEPDNPQAMWIASAWSQDMDIRTVLRATIDYAQKTWQVHSTYKYVSPANPLMHDSGNEGSFFHIRRHAGVNYFVIEGAPCIHKIDEQAWRLMPVTALTGEYQWNDQNGDGLVQEAEKVPLGGPLASAFSVSHVDSNFDYFFIDIAHRPFQVRRMSVAKWNEQGAPVYGGLPSGEVCGECPDRFNRATHNDVRWASFLYHDTASGNLYGVLNPGTANWCTSADSFMQQWNPRHEATWAAGELGPAPTSANGRHVPSRPGLIYWNLRGIAGVTHGCVVAIDVDGGWTNERAQTYVWDQDGLFVGGIMDRPDLNAAPDFMYHCGGEFAHSDLFTLPSGDVYFAGNWESDMRIFKVTGWDNWTRQSGTLSIADSTADDTGQGLTAEYFDGTTFADPRTVRVDPRIDFDWGDKVPAGVGLDAADNYCVRWRGTVRPVLGPKYLGYWTKSQPEKGFYEKTAHGGRDNGAQVEFKFRGTSVSVSGLKAPNCGMANFYVDGQQVVKHYDCYSAASAYDETLFEASGLPDGDHVLVVEVVGWLATPRNKDATDSYIYVDKFVVDGVAIDDAGLRFTFYTIADDGAQFWLGSSGRSDADTCLIYDWSVKSDAHETASAPVTLERTDYPIQLNYYRQSGPARVALGWSSPQTARQIVPTSALFPVATQNPIPAVIMECAFVGTDTKTQGNWKDAYGRDGYVIPNAGNKYPTYLTMEQSGNFYTWWAPGSDVRALQQPTGEARSVGAWYSVAPNSMTYDLKFFDNQWRKLSVYTLDHASEHRKTRFEILDATGQLLDTRDAVEFHTGIYVSWNVRGHVLLRISPLEKSGSAQVFGFFFDPAEHPATR